MTSAGADTTVSAIGTFFLAMVIYPEVQKEAQTELDNVLNGRLPESLWTPLQMNNPKISGEVTQSPIVLMNTG